MATGFPQISNMDQYGEKTLAAQITQTEDRILEVATILAEGVLRQRTRVQLALQSSQFAPPAPEIALDCGPEASGDGVIEPIRRPRL